MDKRSSFRYWFPEPSKGPLVAMTADEAETMLLKRLDDEKDDPAAALESLAVFYKASGQHEKAIKIFRKLEQNAPDPLAKATWIMSMGQTMEVAQDYEAAIRYYEEAEALDPPPSPTAYLIHNNLGYCLNTLERFTEGEAYCRRALEIDPNRPNAHKNLALSFRGQGRYREAARCFVRATRVNAADPRAAYLLAELLREHPELEAEFRDDADACRAVVERIAKQQNAMQPPVLHGWRKRLALLRIGLRDRLRRLRASDERPKRDRSR